MGSTREFYKKLLARHLNGHVGPQEVRNNCILLDMVTLFVAPQVYKSTDEESSEEDQPAAVVRVSSVFNYSEVMAHGVIK